MWSDVVKMGNMSNVEIQRSLCGNISCVSSSLNRKDCCSFESCHYFLQGGSCSAPTRVTGLGYFSLLLTLVS